MGVPLTTIVNCRYLFGRVCALGAFRDPSPLTCARACKRRVPIRDDGPAMIAAPTFVIPTPTPIVTAAAYYAERWAELFDRARGPVVDAAAELAALREYGQRLPCGDCKAHFLAWLDATPPHVLDVAAYARALVICKNGVNVRIGKPTMAIADALAALGFDDA